MGRRLSLQILLPIEVYDEDKIYDSADIQLRTADYNKTPDNVYYRRLKEKTVYASFDDIVKFARQKFSLGEMHSFSMHTDYSGDCVISYEDNKYIITKDEVQQLEREHVTETVYCNEFKYCSLSWYYTSIGDELVPDDIAIVDDALIQRASALIGLNPKRIWQKGRLMSLKMMLEGKISL